MRPERVLDHFDGGYVYLKPSCIRTDRRKYWSGVLDATPTIVRYEQTRKAWKKHNAKTKGCRYVWHYFLVNVLGKFVREDCALCGSSDNIHCHHENYDEPFSIMFLCARCHIGLRNQNGN